MKRLRELTPGGWLPLIAALLATLYPALLQAQNWEHATVPDGFLLSSVAIPAGETGVAVGIDGRILRSVNGGRAWTPVTSGTAYPLFGLAFGSGTFGLAAGYNGTVLRTTDGGASWNRLTPIPEGYLIGAFLLDTLHGFIMGNPLLRTDNGGEAWKDLPVQFEGGITDIWMVDSATSYAVGPYGIVGSGGVFTTTDAGAHWTFINTPAGNRDLFAITFGDRNSAFAVGSSGLVLHSSDGGGNWQEQQSGVTAALYDVAFRDGSDGFAVGENGTIIHTTDAGAHWTREEIGSTDTLKSVAYRGDLALAAGEGNGRGVILRRAGSSGVSYGHAPSPEIGLSSVAPNPVATLGTVSFSLPARAAIRLSVTASSGNEVMVLREETAEAGDHVVRFDLSELPAGAYFIRLAAGGVSRSSPFVVVR
jgi:photosystem II stability/assembly factor-like uncharacterized protein